MENDQFDRLSRAALGAATSRRQVIKILAGGMLLSVLGMVPGGERAAAPV